MKMDNSFGKSWFVLEHIIWMLIAWIWYKNILFRCLSSCSFMESKLILFGILSVSCIVGILLEIRNRRNSASIFLNLAIGYGTYTVMSYIQIRRMLIIICLSIAMALSTLCAVRIMCRKIRNKNRFGQILSNRIVKTIFVAHRLIGLSLMFIMAFSGANILFGSSIMKSKIAPTLQNRSHNQLLSDNLETISMLQDNKWSGITVQERLNILQVVANIEQESLGIPNELNVGSANLNDGVLGYYSDRSHEIIIDMDSLLDNQSWEALDTVCHEAYHSYQHRIVEVLNDVDETRKRLKLLRKANSYMNEFENYINGDEDFCSYYHQDCETDARGYAEDAVKKYHRLINKYLQ